MTLPLRSRFVRYGRALQLRIETAADLRSAAELDEALWVATNAPVDTLAADPTFLRRLDLDGNGRIMCFEVREAIRWLFATLRSTEGIASGRSELRLDDLAEEGEEARRARRSAEKMLRSLDLPLTASLDLTQVRSIKHAVEAQPVSEAGVVLPEASDDPELQAFVRDILATVGGVEHPSGAQGVTAELLERFLAEAAARLAWLERGKEPAASAEPSPILPLGTATAAAYAAASALRPKLDQYFAQCEAAALDPRFVQRMGWTEDELEALDFDDPQVLDLVLQRAPLALASAARELRFAEVRNPRFSDALAALRRDLLAPWLGADAPEVALDAETWGRAKRLLAGHEAWRAAEPADTLGALSEEALRRAVEPHCAAGLRSLIEISRDTAFDLDNVRLIEKLLLYQARLFELANNFVSFPHLYDPQRRALFEMGTLVMDGRRFTLAVRVRDRARHSELARTSRMFVLYVQVQPRDDAARYEVAVPVTCGGRGNLCVGKRGVFQDVQGQEHDAVVVQIIENPISLREALAAPFRRLLRMATGRIESWASESEESLGSKARSLVAQSEKAAAPAASEASGGAAMSGSLLAGGGVALAALSSAFAYVGKTLAGLGWAKVGIGLGTATLAVVLPGAILAFTKLRSRDLSAILEGSGWGINARMRLTFQQGRVFTQRPRASQLSVAASPTAEPPLP